MAQINKTTAKSFYVLALARISLGFIFLWAFLDKLFGLGFSTCRDSASNAVQTGCSQAWLHGGSPTSGFLGHAVQGPFAGWYHSLAGQGWVDWLFMLCLLFVGVSLLLGVLMRLATLAGIALLALMWSSLLWPAANPFMDEHIIYILVLIILNLVNSQQRWGLRHRWLKSVYVQKIPLLE